MDSVKAHLSLFDVMLYAFIPFYAVGNKGYDRPLATLFFIYGLFDTLPHVSHKSVRTFA